MLRFVRAMRRWMVPLVILGLPGCAATHGSMGGHGATEVRGTVRPAAQVAAATAVDASPRDAVVYLDATQAGAVGRKPVATTAVVRVGRRFEPRVMAVSLGSKVRFENHDSLYHSVFSVSPVRRFDTGLFGPDHAKTIVFDQPGIIEIHCSIDDAVGYVVVVPHATFARPDADGRFSLGTLRRGTWTLRAWHPSWGTASTTLEVGASTPAATLRFAGTVPHTSALP